MSQAPEPTADTKGLLSTERPRRLLVIDDNEAIHADFRKTLLAARRDVSMDSDEELLFGRRRAAPPPVEFRIESALQGEHGLRMVEQAKLEGDPYLLAFVDMRMPPGWDGVQTIQKLWAADPHLQVVICTAYSDYSWEQISTELGTSDRMLILKKPFDDIEACQLASTLTEKWLVTRRAEMKRNELEQLVATRTDELRNTALRDRLTGLPNRELLLERIGQAISHSRRSPDWRFALLFIDFDRFKVVNDSLGHEVGDLLLISIANRLRACMRATAIATELTPSRLGGDEFVVLLEGLDDDEAAVRLTERLLQDLARPHDVKGHRVHSTASIGITTSTTGYTSAEAVLRDADNAMYRAKAAGKNRYVLFDQRMHAEAVARLELENDLRAAVAGRKFVLHYQPIISLSDGRVSGFEALIRWRRHETGLVSPLEFIPLAEEIGVIDDIGRWALAEACAQLATWRRDHADLARLTMSVNLSRRELARQTLAADVARVLADTSLPAEALVLEITEVAIMADADSAIAILEQIRAIGVKLHIDDFGTGYSSLSCLHRFPISGLKIDRSFIRNVSERRDYAAVVDAIVALARNLKIELVAEGIEKMEQLALLQALGCDAAQGYLFARPMPAPDAVRYALAKDQLSVAMDRAA